MLKFAKLELKQIVSPILPFLSHVDAYIDNAITTELKILNIGGRQVFSNPGKKIRASFVLLGAAVSRSQNSQISSKDSFLLEEAVALGAGVELVHAATLIHDDIIDNASTRRGTETVSKRWDSKTAVLIGDWLFTKGLDIAALEKHPKIVPDLIVATREMVKGELAQLEYSNIENINEEKYMQIITAKTARFLGTCIRVGALSQGLDEKLADRLFQFGYLCGLGFQISDDAMDFSNKKLTGKDQANDYMEGKVTLPIIVLLSESKAIQKEVENLYKDRSIDKFQRLKELVQENGATEKSLQKAKNFVEQGLDNLTFFENVNLGKKGDKDAQPLIILKKLAQFFIDRKY